MNAGKIVGKVLDFAGILHFTQTYRKYADQIDPYPKNLEETIPSLEVLCQHILDPAIDYFGKDRFQLTYGFCSKDLKRFLSQRDPETGMKHGRVDPSRDQHMAREKNRNGRYYCDHLGAACDFRIVRMDSDRLVKWILEQQLPFDSLYYYGSDRPIHISYGSQHRQNIWAFTDKGVPTRKGIERWIEQVKSTF